MSARPCYHFGDRIDAADFQSSQAVDGPWAPHLPVIEQQEIARVLGPAARPPRRGRANPLAAAWRWVRCMVLRLQIWDTKRYLLSCHADQLVDSLSLREFRQQLDDMQAELQELEVPS